MGDKDNGEKERRVYKENGGKDKDRRREGVEMGREVGCGGR